jgi:hypothetical protein
MIHFHWNRPLDFAKAPELMGDVRAQGGTLVEYVLVASALVLTWRRPYLVRIRPGRNRVVAGLPYAAFSAVLGWWSLMGFFWTIQALVQNLKGGVDMTAALMDPQDSPFADGAAEKERTSRRVVALAYAGILVALLAIAIAYCVLPYLKELGRVL